MEWVSSVCETISAAIMWNECHILNFIIDSNILCFGISYKDKI
jgi:hypothetical protein